MLRSIASRLALAGCLFALASCGEQLKDVSYTNPEWRAGLKGAVSFPLPQEITVTVGLSARMARPGADNLSLQWLQKRTNIRLEFVGLPESPGDVELGQMIRAGKLPDIVPEDRIDLGEQWGRRLFVNVAEFPALVPSFMARLRADPELLAGSLARTTESGELYSVGSYRRDRTPYGGVLAYRRDLFEARGLPTGTWEEVAASLAELKRAYPTSLPFGGSFGTLLALMPSWFGSGYDPQNAVYYDPDRRDWSLGPAEQPFRAMVSFLAELYREGLLNGDLFVGQEDNTPRFVSSGTTFMAPWRGATGPFFPFYGEGYGKLGENGEWDGTGAWIESLPLPKPTSGRPRATASLYSRVGPGWLVSNQSPRAAEALALLDFMYDPEATAAMSLGPEGTVWERDGTRVRLTGTLMDSYVAGGGTAVRKALEERGIAVGLDLGGQEWSYLDAFGVSGGAPYRYYAAHDLAVNRPGIDVPLDPGVRVPRDRTFQEERAGAVVSLKTAIESGVANFIVGRKPLAEYDAFVAELRKLGGDKLLALYRERAKLVDPAVLLGK